MKKRVILAMFLVLVCMTTSALAIEVLPKDEMRTPKEKNEIPIVTPEPRAVLVGAERDKLVENTEFEDQGTVWVEWNGKVISDYGCSTAKMNYTNPTRSNIGVTLSVAIFDADLVNYFGTTFRTVEEQVYMAATGLEALKSGINISTASKLVTNNDYFSGMTAEELNAMSSEELINFLGNKNFINKTAEELRVLDEASLIELDEFQRLELAQLGIYNPYEFYQMIGGETGVINPGYALYEIDLYTLPGKNVLPKGEYAAVFVLNGYMEDKNELSDFFIHLPIELQVKEDLPVEVQEEYSVNLLNRVD